MYWALYFYEHVAFTRQDVRVHHKTSTYEMNFVWMFNIALLYNATVILNFFNYGNLKRLFLNSFAIIFVKVEK